MNVMIFALSALTVYVPAVAALPDVAMAQSTRPQGAIAQETPTTPQQRTTQKLCSVDAVEGLLPSPTAEQSRSPLSYLALQGFTQKPDGSWVCYVRDNRKQERYYTLFKVQQINGTLIASSFLDSGNLVEGQEDHTLDLFMAVIENHTNTNQGNRQSIQKYLESFISLVKQGKVSPSSRGYLFDQPSSGIVVYHPVTEGDLKGTAITININSPQKSSSPAS